MLFMVRHYKRSSKRERLHLKSKPFVKCRSQFTTRLCHSQGFIGASSASQRLVDLPQAPQDASTYLWPFDAPLWAKNTVSVPTPPLQSYSCRKSSQGPCTCRWVARTTISW